MKPLNQKTGYVTALITLLCGMVAIAQNTAPLAPALVDFDAYEKLVAEVKEHRKTRMLNLEEFKIMSKKENVMILDTRSDSMFAAVHVKGAIHINFSDFTQETLAKIIPSKDYKILIYCNNNFNTKPLIPATSDLPDFSRYFATKGVTIDPAILKPLFVNIQSSGRSKKKKKQVQKTMPVKQKASIVSKQLTEPITATKPLTLALNIPTYINLYGYGYKNVYELSDLVNTFNSLEFEGTATTKTLNSN